MKLISPKQSNYLYAIQQDAKHALDEIYGDYITQHFFSALKVPEKNVASMNVEQDGLVFGHMLVYTVKYQAFKTQTGGSVKTLMGCRPRLNKYHDVIFTEDGLIKPQLREQFMSYDSGVLYILDRVEFLAEHREDGNTRMFINMAMMEYLKTDGIIVTQMTPLQFEDKLVPWREPSWNMGLRLNQFPHDRGIAVEKLKRHFKAMCFHDLEHNDIMCTGGKYFARKSAEDREFMRGASQDDVVFEA